MKLIRITIMLVLGLNAMLYAKGAGSTALATLTQPVTAKSAALAEAYTAVSGDIASLHYNPAGLSELRGLNVTAMYQQGLAEDDFASLLLGQEFGFGTLALGVVYYDTGKIDMFDLQGTKISKTGQQDIIASLGTGIPLLEHRLGLGIAVKGISSEIFGETGSTFAVDCGVQYRNLVENLDIGLSALNLGSGIEYVAEKEDLPSRIQPGMTYRLTFDEHHLTASLDAAHLINEEDTLALIGLEYVYDQLFALRSGFRSGDSDDESNVRLGVGFMWKNYAVDYAIGITDNLDNPHFISVNMKF
ncbi:MAG: PorV/PorQ family protein [Elusimicrobia bacterium]|nr:PorV/PorQ family protein [Elusimicrobiota bacterium]